MARNGREWVRLRIGGKGAGMFLEATWKMRQLGSGMLLFTGLILGGTGCTSGPEEVRNARAQNQRMDVMEKSGQDLARGSNPTAVRSQSPAKPPNILPPDPEQPTAISPVTSIVPEENPPTPLPVQGDSQVRIVATIGTTPIYDREVREAIHQRLPEFINLPTLQSQAKQKEMYKEELRKIIERELILDELFSMLKQKKQQAALSSLQEAATKDADNRLRDIRKRAKLASEDDLKIFLQSQGLTISGIRRHFERSFMMSAYLGERLKPKMNAFGLVEVRDYYDEHADEFQTPDRVKWQNLFVRVDRFNSQEDAAKYAEWLKNRAKAEDFAKLLELDQGDSKSRDGFGFGEERGKIFPPELEETVFSLKQGEVAMVDFGTGYHIVRISERVVAGKRPFDEPLQVEIRKRLGNQTSEREYRKIVENLWRRSQPQILAD